MLNKVNGKTIWNTLFRGNRRYTAALVVSVCVHSLIYLYYSPNYDEVKDIAVEFELVASELDQPVAPEADGPRTNIEEPKNDEEQLDLPEELPAPDDGGTIVGDTDLQLDSDGMLEEKDTDTLLADADSDSNSDSDSDTSAIKDTDSTSDQGTDSNSDHDTDSAIDSDTALASADTDTDSQTDAQNDSDSASKTKIASTPDTDSSTDSASTGNAVAGADTDTTGKKNGFPDSHGAVGGTEDGICLHDVFSYGVHNPSWMTWLSMKAFANTRYEQGLAGILNSFHLYDEMVSATEINPLTELEGVLISAENFADFDTYQIVTTYNVGQEELKRRLLKNNGKKPGFAISQTEQGVTGILKNSYRWDMVGSGRVMVASDAEKGKFNKKWPKNITCMMGRPPFTGNSAKQFETLVRSKIGPAKKGDRWPVLLMATRDPFAVGLHRNPELAKMFQYAVMKGYFSDPIQIEGEAKFNGSAQDMVKVEYMVKYILKKADYLKYLGLGGITDKIVYRIENDTLYFTVPLTEKQVMVALLVLKSYSKMLNDSFKKQKK